MKWFFLLGCHRSGTTMLQQALNRHSQIVIPPETKFFCSFMGYCARCQARRLQIINKDLGIHVPAPSRRISSPREVRAFFEQLATTYLKKLGRTSVGFFGEKTPQHASHYRRIRRVFPEAKLIYLYRDGRDVALSLSRMPWMQPDLYVNFEIWLYYYRILKKFQSSGLQDLYCLRYEDLARNPEAELAKLLSFLGLPYEPLVAQGSGNREGISDRKFPWMARAMKPISVERIGTWREELTATQIAVLESLGGSALKDLGYELSSASPAPLPLSFRLRLACKMAAFALRQPWPSLVNEFFGRSWCSPGLH